MSDLLAQIRPEDDDVIRIQTEVAERLRSLPVFGRVPVLIESVGDIERAIETSLAGLGAYALVLTPSAPVPHPNLPGPTFGAIQLVVRCGEMALVNRAPGGAQLSAFFLAKQAMAALHQWRPPVSGGFAIADRAGVTRANEVPPDEIAYDANLILDAR